MSNKMRHEPYNHNNVSEFSFNINGSDPPIRSHDYNTNAAPNSYIPQTQQNIPYAHDEAMPERTNSRKREHENSTHDNNVKRSDNLKSGRGQGICKEANYNAPSDSRDNRSFESTKRTKRTEKSFREGGKAPCAPLKIDREHKFKRTIKDKYREPMTRRTSSSGNKFLLKSGKWSAYLSKKGKLYFYNAKTDRSQWNKPKDWFGSERQLQKKINIYRSRLGDYKEPKHDGSKKHDSHRKHPKHKDDKKSRKSLQKQAQSDDDDDKKQRSISKISKKNLEVDENKKLRRNQTSSKVDMESEDNNTTSSKLDLNMKKSKKVLEVRKKAESVEKKEKSKSRKENDDKDEDAELKQKEKKAKTENTEKIAQENAELLVQYAEYKERHINRMTLELNMMDDDTVSLDKICNGHYPRRNLFRGHKNVIHRKTMLLETITRSQWDLTEGNAVISTNITSFPASLDNRSDQKAVMKTDRPSKEPQKILSPKNEIKDAKAVMAIKEKLQNEKNTSSAIKMKKKCRNNSVDTITECLLSIKNKFDLPQISFKDEKVDFAIKQDQLKSQSNLWTTHPNCLPFANRAGRTQSLDEVTPFTVQKSDRDADVLIQQANKYAAERRVLQLEYKKLCAEDNTNSYQLSKNADESTFVERLKSVRERIRQLEEL